MNLPSAEQFLQKLEANPSAAKAFDAATRREHPECKSRREAVVQCLRDVLSLKTETAKLKSQISAKRERITALEKARAASAPARLFTSSPKAIAKPAPKAPAPAPVVAQSIATLKRGETLTGRRYCKPVPTTSPNRPRI